MCSLIHGGGVGVWWGWTGVVGVESCEEDQGYGRGAGVWCGSGV